MPTAGQVAIELRRLADALDKHPDTNIVKPWVQFYHGYYATKDQFLAVAKILPRPLTKSDGYNHDEFRLNYESDALDFHASIDRAKMCRLIAPAQPAKYECEPLLSAEEEASLGAA